MAAEIMERNLNLEEIGGDALFGLKAFKYQSIGQKVLFFGLVGLGVLTNVALPLIFDISRLVCVFILIILLLIAVSFGCNYEEGITYGRYAYQLIFKPVRRIDFISSLDKKRLRKKNNELIEKENEKLKQIKSIDKGEQRKLIKKLIIFAALIIVIIIGAFTFSSIKDRTNIHHEVEGSEINE